MRNDGCDYIKDCCLVGLNEKMTVAMRGPLLYMLAGWANVRMVNLAKLVDGTEPKL